MEPERPSLPQVLYPPKPLGVMEPERPSLPQVSYPPKPLGVMEPERPSLPQVLYPPRPFGVMVPWRPSLPQVLYPPRPLGVMVPNSWARTWPPETRTAESIAANTNLFIRSVSPIREYSLNNCNYTSVFARVNPRAPATPTPSAAPSGVATPQPALS